MSKVRIAIEGAFEPIEIDLWGTLFETRSMPRSRARNARTAQMEIDRLSRQQSGDPDKEAEDEEKIIALYGEIFDLKLVAVDGRKKPSKLLLEKWEKDELTGEELAAFLAKLSLAEAQQLREDLSEFIPEERPT